MKWSDLLPITAVVAILLFLSKETLEYFRRKKSDKRRLSAFAALLARECELNLWAIKSLRYIVGKIPTDEAPDPQFRISIERKPSGRHYARIFTDDGGSDSNSGIAKVHREVISKFLVDIAALDKRLFDVVEPAYDGLAEVEHVRESLINIDDAAEFLSREDYLAGFAPYAVGVLKDSEEKLGKLYTHCTGKPLTKHRLR